VNRAIGNFDIAWDPMSWLNLKYTFGADYSSDQRVEGLRRRAPADALLGQLWQGTYDNLVLDGNFVATAEKKWNTNFATTLTLGQNLNSRDLRQVQAKGTTYIDPGLFTLNNTVNSNLQAQNYQQLVRVAGYFAQAGIDLWQQVYVHGGGSCGPVVDVPQGESDELLPESERRVECRRLETRAARWVRSAT
jgi:hypothetical protein